MHKVPKYSCVNAHTSVQHTQVQSILLNSNKNTQTFSFELGGVSNEGEVLTKGVNGVSGGCRNSNIKLNVTGKLSDVELSGVDCT